MARILSNYKLPPNHELRKPTRSKQFLFSPKLISFIIPTYYHLDLLKKCIQSIHNVCMGKKHRSIRYEIIVVEDGGPRKICNELQSLSQSMRFKLVIQDKNMGYTKAVNEGLAYAEGDFIILLNDDIVFEQEEWLDHTLQVFGMHPRIGIMGFRLLYPNHEIQHGGMYYIGGLQLLGHKYWRNPENNPEANKVVRTVAVTGAILAIRREVIEDIGPLNEEYAMLCSDTDFCLTAHTRGWMVVYNGRSCAIHHESQTRGQMELNPNSPIHDVQRRDLIRFREKWSAALADFHNKGQI